MGSRSRSTIPFSISIAVAVVIAKKVLMYFNHVAGNEVPVAYGSLRWRMQLLP
jgi:hypothetical protein